MTTPKARTSIAIGLAAIVLLLGGDGFLFAAAPKKRAPRDQSWAITKVPKEDVICFALYTVHNNILKLTAQLYELDEAAPRTVRLEIKKDGEIVYTLRSKGTTFRPKVFAKGTYTVHAGEGDSRRTIRGVQSIDAGDRKTLEVAN